VIKQLRQIGALVSQIELGYKAKQKHCWRPHSSTVQVRSHSSLRDQSKVPADPSTCAMVPVCVEVLQRGSESGGVCVRPGGFVQKVAEADWDGPPPFIFCVHFITGQHSWAMYFCQRNPFNTPAWARFRNSDPDQRNLKFKMIGRVLHGPFLARPVMMIVGERPAIPGKKLGQHQRYIESDHFFEVEMDVMAPRANSSGMASLLTSTALKWSKSLVVDMVFLIEGHTPDELPEELIGGCQLAYVDLKRIK